MAYTGFKYIIPIDPRNTDGTIQNIKHLYNELREYFSRLFNDSDFKPTDLLLREQWESYDDDSRILMPRKFIFTDIYNSLAEYLADWLHIIPWIDYEDDGNIKKPRAHRIEVIRHWNGLTFECDPYDGAIYVDGRNDKDEEEDEDCELHICYSEINYFSIARSPSEHEEKIGKALMSIPELYGHEQIKKFTSDDYGNHKIGKAIHEIITSFESLTSLGR